MLEDSAPLILGSKAIFTDNHSSRLTALEVDESWEVLNIAISQGILRWIQRVRLPFDLAGNWSETAVNLSCTRTEAFSREIPPIAAPSRPISAETPLALAGSRLSGALVSPDSRKVTDLIIRLGKKLLRVPTTDITFEGKTLRLTVQPDTIPEHRSDRDIAADVWSRLRNDSVIMPDEFRGLEIETAGSIVTLNGNVRRKGTKEHAESLVAQVSGLTELRSQLKDDLQLEIDIAAQLHKAGIQRVSTVYARSSLGDVTLYGRSPAIQIIEDATRVSAAVAGVRSVHSRIEVGSQPASSAERRSGQPAVS